MPTTPNHGLTYPDSSGHTRLWEHLQTLATDTERELDELVAGQAPAAWTNWTAVWTNLPNKSQDCRYIVTREGTVHYQIDVSISGAATGPVSVQLPVPMSAGYVPMINGGHVLARAASGQRWAGLLEQDGNAQGVYQTFRVMVPAASGNTALANMGPSGSVWVPTSGDGLSIRGTYIKAA